MERGERLDAALFRGPRSRNARLEFAWRPTAEAVAPSDPDRVVIGIETDDLAGLEQRLDGDGHGQLGARVDADLFGRRRTGRVLVSAYGATFALLAADRA